MSILTPEQIEEVWQGEDDPYTFVWTPEMIRSVRETLAAYAEVVQKVAEANEWCGWQGVSGLVLDEEEWLKARKLRGM